MTVEIPYAAVLVARTLAALVVIGAIGGVVIGAVVDKVREVRGA